MVLKRGRRGIGIAKEFTACEGSIWLACGQIPLPMTNLIKTAAIRSLVSITWPAPPFAGGVMIYRRLQVDCRIIDGLSAE